MSAVVPAQRALCLTAVLSALLAVCVPAVAAAQTTATPPSPEQVLGYAIGDRFTDHASLIRYVEALAEAAPQSVQLHRYGVTVEGRALVQIVVARPDYMTRLDDILTDNRQLADPATPPLQAQQIAASNPGVVYFSYGVHGNESSSSEAAMLTAWDLVRGAPDVAGVLDSLIVVIDPVLNPDGRDRYVNWYHQARGEQPNANPDSREHWEPWPGGRANHYLFDLNRDWAWATQQETRARLTTWNHWTPQVHVDFHEMGYASSYFFFPAAPPINPLYPRHILEWGSYFGDANSRAFDAQGWAYYTGEGFDLFYPGYGDSWPSLVGAIGMTYEQAGSGRAGLAIERPQGDTLTLLQRATQHRTSGNATLRAAAARRADLLTDFARFHQTIDEGLSDILVVPGDPSRADALIQLLQRQGIRVERSTRSFNVDAAPHAGYSRRREFPTGTLLVRARQPRGRLAITLMQPEILLDASFSYDISAWSLPFAYGIEAHSSRRVPDAGWATAAPAAPAAPAAAIDAYGMLAAPGFGTWPAVIRYLKDGGRVRVLNEAFSIEGRSWPRGTFFFPRLGATDFAASVTAAGVDRVAAPVHSGRASEGNDLGTNESLDLRLPRVALLAGAGVGSTSFGAQWFFLEQTLGLPFDQLNIDRLGAADLSSWDVIIAPDLSANAVGSAAESALKAWIEAGGTFVATGTGARRLGASVSDIKLREDPEEADSVRLARALRGREARELDRWEQQVPGAILTLRLDPAHPLVFGAGLSGDAGQLHVLHSGAQAFEPDPAFETVAFFEAGVQRVSGVISARNLDRLENAAWLVTRSVGSGRTILFIDDPVFRHFWYVTFQPFVNAILLGPAL